MSTRVDADEQALEQPAPQPELPLCCAACGQPITRRCWAQQQLGQHEHTFRNPHGYSFHLLCFQQAPGCRVEGPPTAEASWFPGTRWQFALCQGCDTHLGWHYCGRECFFGLIATRLAHRQTQSG